jgi:hypothetical protein
VINAGHSAAHRGQVWHPRVGLAEVLEAHHTQASIEQDVRRRAALSAQLIAQAKHPGAISGIWHTLAHLKAEAALGDTLAAYAGILDQLDRQSGAKLDRRLMEVLDEVRARNERAKKAAGS